MPPETSLPPGPKAPRPIQTLAWGTRPGPFLKRCQARYGDAFTVRIANEDTWVMLSDPDTIKQVFTGQPRAAARRRGEPHPAAGRRAATPSSCSTRART